MQKITPNLWFNDQAEEAVGFYTPQKLALETARAFPCGVALLHYSREP